MLGRGEHLAAPRNPRCRACPADPRTIAPHRRRPCADPPSSLRRRGPSGRRAARRRSARKSSPCPVTRISSAVAAPIRSISSGSRIAPRPMLCGKIVAPMMLLWPCTASVPQIIGMPTPPSHVSIDASQNASASASQLSGVVRLSPPGAELPPFSTEPSLNSRTSAGVTAEMSAWMTWPTFSSSVMRSRSSAMRASVAASRTITDFCSGQLAASTGLAPTGTAAGGVDAGVSVTGVTSSSPQPARIVSASSQSAHGLNDLLKYCIPREPPSAVVIMRTCKS